MVPSDEKRTVKVHLGITSRESTTDWDRLDITADSIPIFVQMSGENLDFIKQSQLESFKEEIDTLRRGKPLKTSSSLITFTPLLDSNGVLRLGGRIRRADLPYDARHPVLLSGHHPLAKKIITAFHIRLQHVGTDFILTHIRQHFWITGGREAVKKAGRTCDYCIRRRAKPAVQLMGDLPSCRLAAGSPPFSQTACDYFGPIETCQVRNRVTKRWGALFTCLVTRAVYVDVATSLSTDDFLLLLRRFIGLYGKPRRIFSDNGTNFVGAERELREAVEQLHNSPAAAAFVKREAIEWHFQPARSPHFGGAHESLVRVTKRALYAALEKEGKALRHPTEDSLRTLLFEVSGLLNSRPLTYASSDPEDIRPLTPNDFLNRPPSADIPAGDFTSALPREHFKYVQRLVGLFWDQWRATYVQSIIDRKKWLTTTRNMEVGDFVMEIDNNKKRGDWSTGKVTKAHKGEDGLVRVVDVQLENGIFRRGIQELCLLEPVSASSSSTDS